LFVFVEKLKALVARKVYHVVITANIPVNGMIRRLEEKMGKCSGGGNAIAQRECGRDQFMILLSGASVYCFVA
jgi:hypothetical protein